MTKPRTIPRAVALFLWACRKLFPLTIVHPFGRNNVLSASVVRGSRAVWFLLWIGNRDKSCSWRLA